MQRSVFISNALFVLAFISFAAQFFIDFSALNIGAACIVLSSSLITLCYLRWTDAYDYYPISSFVLFGLLFTSLLGALLAQSLLWASLTKDLRIPIQTFSYLSMFQMSAIIAHVFYRMLNKTKSTRPSIVRYSLEKMGLYQTPSIVVVWVMGVIGLASAILAKGDGGSKIANGIQFIMWLPFIIPIYRARFGKEYCNAKLNYILLGLYTLVIVVIGIIFNARGFMLIGMVTLGAVIFLETMRSKNKFTVSQLLKILLLLLVGVAASFPLSDLATAMAVARADRGKVSDIKVAQNTFEIMTAKRDQIQRYREAGDIIAGHSSYNEQYIANPLLARFVMTKFHDNIFYYGTKLNDADVQDLADYTLNQIPVLLPSDFLEIKWLNLKIDKLATTYFSAGDYVVMLATGIKVGGFKTGSSLAQGFILFGYFAPILFIFLAVLLFYIKDLFAYKNQLGLVVIAPIGLFGLYGTFINGLSFDGIQGYFTTILRNFPQSVILYVMIYQFARLVDAALSALRNYNSKKYWLKA